MLNTQYGCVPHDDVVQDNDSLPLPHRLRIIIFNYTSNLFTSASPPVIEPYSHVQKTSHIVPNRFVEKSFQAALNYHTALGNRMTFDGADDIFSQVALLF